MYQARQWNFYSVVVCKNQRLFELIIMKPKWDDREEIRKKGAKRWKNEKEKSNKALVKITIILVLPNGFIKVQNQAEKAFIFYLHCLFFCLNYFCGDKSCKLMSFTSKATRGSHISFGVRIRAAVNWEDKRGWEGRADWRWGWEDSNALKGSGQCNYSHHFHHQWYTDRFIYSLAHLLFEMLTSRKV